MLNDQRVSISIISILSPYHGLPERQELKGKADEKFEEIKGKASGHLEASVFEDRGPDDGDMDCHGVIIGYHGFGYLDIYVMGYHGFGYLDIYVMGYHGFGYLDIYVMGYHGFGYWDIYIYLGMIAKF